VSRADAALGRAALARRSAAAAAARKPSSAGAAAAAAAAAARKSSVLPASPRLAGGGGGAAAPGQQPPPAPLALEGDGQFGRDNPMLLLQPQQVGTAAARRGAGHRGSAATAYSTGASQLGAGAGAAGAIGPGAYAGALERALRRASALPSSTGRSGGGSSGFERHSAAAAASRRASSVGLLSGQAADAGPVPEWWEECHTEDAAADVYYLNHASAVSQWDRPAGAAVVSAGAMAAAAAAAAAAGGSGSGQWVCVRDAPTGIEFYVNAATKAAAWSIPLDDLASAAASVSAAAPAAAAALPEGWAVAATSEGDAFFFNAATGESAWALPPTV
jgi:hypothetical protein